MESAPEELESAAGRAVGRGYSEIAPVYDRVTSEDDWMRHVLWERYRRAFGPGDEVLDLGCGTGTDSLFLARQGVRVTGLDVSTGMIAALEAKVVAAKLAGRIESRVGDARELEGWPAESLDGVVSAFAVLNALPDLAPAVRGIAHVLRPGGRAILHLLARPGLWERLARVGALRFAEARALARSRETEVVIGGVRVSHRRYRVAEARALFSTSFRVRSAYALGFFWPRRAGRVIPGRLARACGRLEARLGRRRPWMDWGRFVVLELERESSAAARI